jgi:hypothetical protein
MIRNMRSLGQGQMKPEQLEIARLKREVVSHARSQKAGSREIRTSSRARRSTIILVAKPGLERPRIMPSVGEGQSRTRARATWPAC